MIGERIPRAMLIGAPILVALPAIVDQVHEDTTAGGWALCASAVGLSVAVLLVRQSYPVGSFAATLVITGAAELVAARTDHKLSTLVALPLAFAFYSLGRFTVMRVSGSVALVSVAVMLGALAVNQVTAPPARQGGLDVIAVIAALPFGWALGLLIRSQEERLEQARRDAARREELEQRRLGDARTAERLAVARDMHDVVAHSLTTLTVHAEVLRSRASETPDWVNERIDAVATTARRANQELHGLLATLRSERPSTDGENSEGPAPEPGLADLDELADAARAAGDQVVWEIAEVPESTSRLVESVAYRVVQEALANARRHAAGARVRVTIAPEHDGLAVEVRNAPPPPAQPHDRTQSRTALRLGLLGIVERVHAANGTVTYGPTTDRGFAVRACLPTQTQAPRTGAAS